MKMQAKGMSLVVGNWAVTEDREAAPEASTAWHTPHYEAVRIAFGGLHLKPRDLLRIQAFFGLEGANVWLLFRPMLPTSVALFPPSICPPNLNLRVAPPPTFTLFGLMNPAA